MVKTNVKEIEDDMSNSDVSFVNEDNDYCSASEDGIGSSGSILHEDYDDKSSSNDGYEQDCNGYEEKIRWMFLTSEDKTESE
jgi:hypothetical protein